MRTRDENKEQAIRDKAIEIMVKEGMDGLSMQKLAKEAGVSPATIYIYFKDRQDLIMQVCKKALHDMMEASLRNFDPEMHFAEGLKVQWRNRADYHMKHPLEAQFLEQIKYSNLHDKAEVLLHKKFKDAMKRFVQNALDRKELLPLPFEVYWSVAFAPLYQMLKFNSHRKSHVNNTFKLTDKMMMQGLELVLKALKP